MNGRVLYLGLCRGFFASCAPSNRSTEECLGLFSIVIPVTDSDFRHSRLQESGLAVHRAGNGIIVFVKKKMVVVLSRNSPQSDPHPENPLYVPENHPGKADGIPA